MSLTNSLNNIISNNRYKSLLKTKISGVKNSSGRNSSGKITIFNRGGGHKKKYRTIKFNRNSNFVGIIINIEYDPNRNAYIGAVFDLNSKNYFYILLPHKLSVGDIVKSGSKSEIKLGHSTTLSNIPIGSFIHNVSLTKNNKGKLSRSAGTFSILIEKNKIYSKIKLSSGEQRLLPTDCIATLGLVSTKKETLKKKNKAGRSRWLNKRPRVRGVAMNPVDHPHGGGEGKSSGGKIKLTPWGKPTQGGSTRKLKTPNLIVTRKNDN